MALTAQDLPMTMMDERRNYTAHEASNLNLEVPIEDTKCLRRFLCSLLSAWLGRVQTTWLRKAKA
jgi:hypothetical protein